MEVGNPRFEVVISPSDALTPDPFWPRPIEGRDPASGVPVLSYSPKLWCCGSPNLCFVAKLLFDKGNDILHGAQVVSRHIFIFYYDGETLLNEHY